ncbi:MAG: bifunctional (p)ppGpp synthetase/guanosine-3',5'-bis(diphosphate) 3'-pyrophosphohydrolase, partial [Candidatus Latescibacteria bacterium]|nr:bifunctional (p)ppGpp synthetase/guanosine-3',5'-bis(diphosphate) 3'-pyrophosphohydrolase [Candidatus Latescibacterota bacterium]
LKLKKKPVDELVEIAQSYGLPDTDHLYAAVGRGDIAPAQVGQKLLPHDRQSDVPTDESMLAKFVDRVRKSTGGIKVRGVDNLLLRFAQCCQPVPGDPIVGFVTRGRGVTIHRADCPNSLIDPQRRLQVDWDVDKHQSFLVGFHVFANDRPGLLSEITKAITESSSNITHATMDTGSGLAEGTFTIEVGHLSQFETIIKRIRQVKGVLRAERKSGIEESTDDSLHT